MPTKEFSAVNNSVKRMPEVEPGVNADQVVSLSPPMRTFTLPVQAGQSLSDALNMLNARAFAVALPATFEGTALTFQVSADGAAYQNLYDAQGNEYTLPNVLAGRTYLVPTVDFVGFQYIRIRSGTSGAAAAVAALRNLVVIALG